MRTSTEQKALILKLEHDLSTIQAMSSLPRPSAEGSEVSDMGSIPEPIKEATAMFSGMSEFQQKLLNICPSFLKTSKACSEDRNAATSSQPPKVMEQKCAHSSQYS